VAVEHGVVKVQQYEYTMHPYTHTLTHHTLIIRIISRDREGRLRGAH
jgi:hypothetical protein